MLPLSLKQHQRAILSTELEIDLVAPPRLLTTRLSLLSDPSDVSRKNTKMQILQIDAMGQSSTLELKRSEVLKRTQEAASMKTPMDERKLSPRKSRLQLLSAGSYHAVQAVHARDLRKLDAAFASNNDPCVMVRKQAIVISTDLIRTIIMKDTCLIFLSDHADTFLPTLKAKLRELVAEKECETAFEFRAIEAVLFTMCNLLFTDCEKTFPKITGTLERLSQTQISGPELETLRSLKNTINDFGSQVDGIRRVLMELLDSESDLRLLYLTLLAEDPELLASAVPFDPEEAEALLESYLQEIHTIRTKTKLLQQRIQNTESLIMIKLDSTRNHLLTVDVVFSLVTVSLTFGTFVTAAFGMNLRTGLEGHPTAFAGVMILTLVVSVLLILLGLLYFRKRGVM